VSRTVIRNLATTEGPEGRIESTARPAELRDLDSGMAIVV
jgi:hypothetical protein